MKRILSTLLAAALILSITVDKTIIPSTFTSPQIELEQQDDTSNDGIGEAIAPCDDSGFPSPGGDMPN